MWLRVYRSGDCVGPKGTLPYHNAMTLKFDRISSAIALRGDLNGLGESRPGSDVTDIYVTREDPKWPTTCEHCGAGFSPIDDTRQVFARKLYRGAPDGQLYTLEEMPTGGMYDADWLLGQDGRDNGYTGPDGITLAVKLPASYWLVDSEASNCTRPQRIPVPTPEGEEPTHQWYRFERTHYCWVRHGDPRRPATLNVDKAGDTCAAGAGSIQSGDFHGFLRHGYLTTEG